MSRLLLKMSKFYGDMIVECVVSCCSLPAHLEPWMMAHLTSDILLEYDRTSCEKLEVRTAGFYPMR